MQVLMSKGAKRFITPLTFEAISSNEVLHERSESWADEKNHIKITKKADIVVIAPASANSINKFANGISDNLLTQTFIANTKPTILAPAMNTNMLKHFSTQKSLKLLQKNGVHIVKPVCKKLVCKDEGDGALANIEDIFFATCRALLQDRYWVDKNVVVTGGGTKEKIDDVRYIGNFSSGKMAQNLALALFLKGANVTLVTSAKVQNMPFKVREFSSTNELKEAIKSHSNMTHLFMSAAVSDYRCKNVTKGKLKKSDIGEKWSLELIKNEDILTSIDAKCKRIGFKAEFDAKNALKNAKDMLLHKHLDAVCLNVLGESVQFGSEKTKIDFITKNTTKELPLQSKIKTSFAILKEVKKLHVAV